MSSEASGASTWGATQAEAVKNIESVVVETTLEHGEAIPASPADEVEVSVEPRVTVTL